MRPESQSESKPRLLAKLRGDIAFELTTDQASGQPVVIASDPVRGSYFRIEWPESAALLHWREAGTFEALQDTLRRTYGLDVTTSAIETVGEFAATNQLTEFDATGGWKRLEAIRGAGKHGLLGSLAHNYLFFRIPLLHPEATLRRVAPRLAFLFAWPFWIGVGLVALAGGYLATRQWSAVETAVQDALRLEGILLYAAAVLGLKAVHEFGHALTSVRYGCRVPSMGVAFMLGAPVLYTDVSDSWRLPQRKHRLAIVFAGVAAELIVAAAAILLWCFLPDGLLRQTCFALATTSIVLTLAVNLNPFMRFDGYFALSDALKVPNLQPRSFALATWHLRETLFGLNLRPPETFPRGLHRTLIAYAYLTWIYRLFLFLGIAAIVYVTAGKALGIVLGLFEIVVFIAKPIGQELAEWYKMRNAILRPRRARLTTAVAALGVIALLTPWMRSVAAPAVLLAANEEAVHLPFASRLASIETKEGQRVERGQILFRASSSDIDRQHAKAVIELRSLEMQVNRLHANSKEQETRLVILSKRDKALERIEALERQRQQLVIRAPFAGIVVDIDADITPGVWLNPKQQLARVLAEGGPVVRGLVAESDYARLSIGATAEFHDDDPTRARRTLRLVSLAPASDGRLSELVLSDRHGGSVPTIDERGEQRTRTAWFQATFEVEGPSPDRVMRGIARVDAASISPGRLLLRQVSQVLVREQSF